MSPETGEQVFEPDYSIDWALIECNDCIIHFGIKNLTIPPAGIEFFGVICKFQSTISPTTYDSGLTLAEDRVSVVYWKKNAVFEEVSIALLDD